MDLAVTFKAHARDSLNEANRPEKTTRLTLRDSVATARSQRPRVADNATRWADASYSVAGGEWESLDAQMCEELLPLIWDKEAEVRSRVSAVPYTREWEVREMRRLREEDKSRREREKRSRRERRRGCAVM